MPPDPLWAWPATLREQPRIQSRRTRFYPSCSGPPCASRGTRSGPRRNRWSRAGNRRTLVSSCLLRVSNMAYIRYRVDRGWACCGARSTSLRYACKRATRFDQLQWIISMIVIIHGACIVMYPPEKLYIGPNAYRIEPMRDRFNSNAIWRRTCRVCIVCTLWKLLLFLNFIITKLKR